MNNIAATLMEVESSHQGDNIFLLDRESLHQQNEEREGTLPHPGYMKDAFHTIFPLLESLNVTPLLLTQWGDARASKVLRTVSLVMHQHRLTFSTQPCQS
jgi:hypothetical protein